MSDTQNLLDNQEERTIKNEHFYESTMSMLDFAARLEDPLHFEVITKCLENWERFLP